MVRGNLPQGIICYICFKSLAPGTYAFQIPDGYMCTECATEVFKQSEQYIQLAQQKALGENNVD